MTDQNAITTPNKKSIFSYSDADKRAAQALKMMLPYGSKLTDDNAIALLIYGKIHDLDPLIQECYFLVREKRDDRSGEVKREELGCYPGIKGKRKKAREQILKQQGSYKIEYSIVDPEVLGLKKDQVATCIKGELRDTITTGQYILDCIRLKHEGFDQAFIDMVVGKPPAIIGYGVVKLAEVNYIKMTPAQLARKRAENDCISQRFDLPLGDDTAADGVDYIDAEVTEVEAQLLPKTIGEKQSDAPKKSEQQLLAELGSN